MHSSQRAALVLFVGARLLSPQQIADPFPNGDPQLIYKRILPVIEKILIFDDHSHPGFADDPDVDAMVSPPGVQALRIRIENPELVAASRSLFGYPFSDNSPEHSAWLVTRKAQWKKQQGIEYFSRILDRSGIQTAVANRVAMPDYLDKKRFLWAPFVDSFLFPLNNSAIMTRNIDEQTYLPLQEKKLRRELQSVGLTSLPATLPEYLRFISSVLEKDKQQGAIGIKFEAAYFRSLYFSDPSEQDAAAVYERNRQGGIPPDADYTLFQDFVFRHLLREALRLKLAVTFHTSVGISSFFNLQSGNVLNLENVLRDPRYVGIRFVLLHGGFPYDRQAIWLASRSNVFIDSSLTDLYLYPSQFREVLKYWLSTYPEKVVFGSDAFPFNETLGAEEAYWLSVQSSRKALAAALAELISEHALSEPQALKIAHGYLHDNAAAIYSFENIRAN